MTVINLATEGKKLIVGTRFDLETTDAVWQERAIASDRAGVIVDQRQEIDAMRGAIGRPRLLLVPVPLQPPPAGQLVPNLHSQERQP